MDASQEQKFRAWLNEPQPPTPPGLEPPPVPTPTRLDYFCYLVACNGGKTVVRGWGVIGYGAGPFKQGLEMREALDLMQLVAFITGVEFVCGGAQALMDPMIDAWLKARLAEHEAANNAGRI